MFTLLVKEIKLMYDFFFLTNKYYYIDRRTPHMEVKIQQQEYDFSAYMQEDKTIF